MKISVIGAGVMGARITEVFLKADYDVTMIDINRDHCDSALNRIIADLSIGIEKGKLTAADKYAALDRLTISNMVSDAAGSAFVLECITEKLEAKTALMKQLDTIVDDDCIIGTNTSALPISEIARAVPKRASRIMGVHFFNPAHIMQLVEVTRTISTDDAAVDAVHDIITQSDKCPIVVNEGAGFVVNRILIPEINEAVSIYADNIASPSDIDRAMQLGAGMKVGPLHTADLVGLDDILADLTNMYEETGDPKYHPHPLLRKMVRAGLLGQKTGRGFFTYKYPFGPEVPGGELKIK
ncbi:MAG: 3-hydroxyacyl-CoA dehydrogenase NAD-binding domain-containing protein [Eubacteriales bacterium]|nr:3-hydroxyacyl-CoA dehydrogenase NAD-binding domain-containing protein [Eubacteriales bacterium]